MEKIGKISALKENADGRRFVIYVDQLIEDLGLGASISVNGCCLTVVEILSEDQIAVEVSHQTLRCTDLGQLKINDGVNLERPLKFSDRLGGHLVSGHVDTVGKIISIKPDGFSQLVTISLAKQYAQYFIEKGSVTVSGVSLTVASIDDSLEQNQSEFYFTVALIPHTMQVTTLGKLKVGQTVNIETDIIAKYLARGRSLSSGIENADLREKEPAVASYAK